MFSEDRKAFLKNSNLDLHKPTLSELSRCIMNRAKHRHFITLESPPGTGKTRVFKLLETTKDEVTDMMYVSFLDNRRNPAEIFRDVLRLPLDSEAEWKLFGPTLIVVDDAQCKFKDNFWKSIEKKIRALSPHTHVSLLFAITEGSSTNSKPSVFKNWSSIRFNAVDPESIKESSKAIASAPLPINNGPVKK